MESAWQLPNELLITSLSPQFPGREAQIRVLTTLLCPSFPAPKNVVLHGLEATGKSVITKKILESLSNRKDPNLAAGESPVDPPDWRYAIVRCAECITGRHLLERSLGSVARALERTDHSSRCENLAQLAVELGKLLERYEDESGPGRRFVLVFDGIDKQRDPPSTLLPALARLGESIPNLTTVFIVTHPRPNFLHISGAPHIHFPSYNKAQAIKILSLQPGVLFPPDSDSSSEENEGELERIQRDSLEIWTKFCSSVWDSLSKHTGNDIVSFRTLCHRLWTPFIQPLLNETYTTKQFSKLFLAQRSLFQNEKILLPNLISSRFPLVLDSKTTVQATNGTVRCEEPVSSQGMELQLPYYSRILLIAAYLCSHNHPRTDTLHFSHTSIQRRRKKGGGTAVTPTSRRPGIVKHRKIQRRLIGAQGFLMERWLAVFWAMCNESNGVGRRGAPREGMTARTRTADVELGIATLVSLRLVGKMGAAGSGGVAGDVLDRGIKWRVSIGWEGARSVARSVGVELEDFLAE